MMSRLLPLFVIPLLLAPTAIADEQANDPLLGELLSRAVATHETRTVELQAQLNQFTNDLHVARAQLEAERATASRTDLRYRRVEIEELERKIEDLGKVLETHGRTLPQLGKRTAHGEGGTIKVYDVRLLQDAGENVFEAFRQNAPGIKAMAVEGRYAAVLATRGPHARIRALVTPRGNTWVVTKEHTPELVIYDVSDLLERMTGEKLIERIRMVEPSADLRFSGRNRVLVAKTNAPGHVHIKGVLNELRGGAPAERFAIDTHEVENAAEIAHLQKSIADLKRWITNEERALADARKRKESWKVELTEKRIAAAQDSLAEATRILAEEMGELRVPAEQEWEEAADSARAAANRIEAQQAAIADLQRQISAVASERATIAKRLEEAGLSNDRIRQLRADLAALQAQQDGLRTELASASEALTDANAALVELRRKDVFEAGRSFREWTEVQEYAGHRNAVDTADLRRRIEALRAAHREVDGEARAQLERRIRDLEQELVNAERARHGTQGQRDLLDAIHSVRADVSALRTEVAELTELVRQLVRERGR